MTVKRQKQIRYKKDLVRVNWDMLESIISALFEHGKMNNTKISTICGMNYGSLVKYLARLESLRLVTCSSEGRLKFVTLAPRGIEYFKREIVHVKSALYA